MRNDLSERYFSGMISAARDFAVIDTGCAVSISKFEKDNSPAPADGWGMEGEWFSCCRSGHRIGDQDAEVHTLKYSHELNLVPLQPSRLSSDYSAETDIARYSLRIWANSTRPSALLALLSASLK